MLEVYTIYGGDMWRQAFNAVVTILSTSTWGTLLRIVGIFSVLGALYAFIKNRNPMSFLHWIAIFVILTSILLVPKRSVQVIDVTDRAGVYVVDNVPVGLAAIASLTTSIGFHLAELYDYVMARPDSVTYTKSGMLFGSQIVAETSDFRTQNPDLAQMLPDYVENCVIGDILLNHKYTVNQLLNTTDPLALITNNPSPLRGIYKTTGGVREFITCQQAATEIKTLANTDSQPGSATATWLATKIFGNRVNATSLLANAMGDSYGYFYAGGMSAAQIMKNNITNSAIRQGVKGFAARSSDTANLVNLASESAATKQRLAWAAGSTLATRTLPFAQSLLMLILVCLFPLVIALAASNHSLFGLNTLKLYVSGFIYFQMWPLMFAILNFASTFWLQTKTGGTALVLANSDQVALQHSDVANLAGYLSLSIPVLSFYLTKGAAAMGSQVAGSMLSSMAFGSAGVAGTTADGNWSFNNMSMDNVNQNKFDTNLMQRQGQQTWQADNGSTRTITASGQNVIDGSGAMSNLPVSMKLSQLASSGFQESARQSQVQAQTALEGYSHNVTSGWEQLSQLSHQNGSSDSLSSGSDNSQATNASRGASMMMSAAESYAKANNISTQQAYNQLMDISNQGSASVGASVQGKWSSGDQLAGKVGKWATGLSVSAEGHANGELRHSSGSSQGIQDSHGNSTDFRHDKNSQAVNDFRQGMDMVTSSRVSDSANHTDNAATINVQQFAATLKDAKSQYQQYSTSSTQSNEFSKMATLAQNQSASLDTNYTQEFANWAANKYGDKAQEMLTSAPSAREAAMEFVNERLKPEIMGDYQQERADLQSGNSHNTFASSASSDGASSVQSQGGSSFSHSEGAGASSSGYSNNGTASTQAARQDGHAEGYRASSEADHGSSVIQTHSSSSEGHSGGNAQQRSESTYSPSNSQSSTVHHAGSRGGVTTVSGGGEVRPAGDTFTGQGARNDFQRNQEALQQKTSEGFGGGGEIAQRVAAQRSANEQNINNSSGEIDKKQSTVQTSSDNMKGENHGAQGRFAVGRKEAEYDQSSSVNPLNKLDPSEIKSQLEHLRKKSSGG
ncbi:conjugal transfer mating-pair stabilization protein TraG [Yokenella regensburgei]|uniref:conjugal transfer mating-pair stabilization protein TraG n=1 Tax=Yokenella regensburgei TaxID=158877 RepID=UPI003ED95414